MKRQSYRASLYQATAWSVICRCLGGSPSRFQYSKGHDLHYFLEMGSMGNFRGLHMAPWVPWFTAHLQVELGPQGIDCVSLWPGVVYTEFVQSLLLGLQWGNFTNQKKLVYLKIWTVPQNGLFNWETNASWVSLFCKRERVMLINKHGGMLNKSEQWTYW